MERIIIANIEETIEFFELIKKRIEWMDSKGLRSWNTCNYLEIFPLEYFLNCQKMNQLVIMKKDDHVVAGAIILEEDERWDDGASALYIHTFVTSPQEHGIGKVFLDACETLAKKKKKTFLRLDCAVDNEGLNYYYENLGFVYRGSCTEGPYRGNRREKRVNEMEEKE